jgi:diguanylate cyclase
MPDPQLRPAHDDAALHAEAAAPAGNSAAPSAQANIVVIDDEPLNTAALIDFLRGIGYTQVASLSGSEVTAQALRDEQPDLVLLELGLTQGRAFEVLGWMQAERMLRHVPVIVLATHEDLASRLRALALGAADCLVKPIDAVELDLRLRNTLAVKAHRDQLAHTDHLTGLPNRESLLWRLDWALKQSCRHGGVGAVLQLGLDRFKQVNDALGPAVGDELLHAVAQRLVAGLRGSDMVARGRASRAAAMLSRGSGDEFTMLLPVIDRVEDAAVVAKRMIERMTEPFAVAGHELFVSCRVGIAVFPGDSDDKDTVLQHAGVAMRCARQAGQVAGSGIQFYSERLNSRALQQISLERELHHALERDEFRLHYQPQVDVLTGRVCGAEALVRWQHPQRGLLGPGEFIAVAEAAGLIVRLGNWVLREALRQLAAWRHSGLNLAQMAVNVSSLQLQRAGLCDDVRDALTSAGVEARGLCLELTESAIIDSGPQVTETLEAIKRLGVQLALDDFGTGYSSLTYLRRFPIDELKIDRSFVSDCDSDGNNSALTAAIIAMALRLGLRVVAEGVETAQQLAFIRANGAETFQGYLFARPLPADEFGALLRLGNADETVDLFDPLCSAEHSAA